MILWWSGVVCEAVLTPDAGDGSARQTAEHIPGPFGPVWMNGLVAPGIAAGTV
jgi:hypothetical protein